jgi:alpha-D-ribose 1-methylphosphonate 5-triphosphate diphosphatase PhnM
MARPTTLLIVLLVLMLVVVVVVVWALGACCARAPISAASLPTAATMKKVQRSIEKGVAAAAFPLAPELTN